MRFLCFPCSATYGVHDISVVQPAVLKDDNEITEPTGTEYASEAAKEFLKILEEVAEAVPIPGFGTAVKVAANIVKACEDSYATLERAQELKLRIRALVLTLVNDLKGKKANEIHTKILEDIETLKRDMHYIEGKLNDIAGQHRLLVVLFRSLNDGKLARDIEQTDLLSRLEKQIFEFHAQQQRSLDNLQLTMDNVKEMLDKRLPSDASSVSSPMRAVIPASSSIFHGRESAVSELVDIITGGSRKHICLLGPGGMGKTSTSLAVMNDPKVETQFAPHLRVWVSCVKAQSASLFVETLRTSLAISKHTGNPLGDILCSLKISPPIILLLDNFETPWNADEGQSEVEEVLRDIHQIPHVTLFVTMRSLSLPCGDIPWHRVDLRAVDASASRKIYTSWYPEGQDDPGLARLLKQIGHMPLAVTLMAKFASSTGLSAEKVVEEYSTLGTAVLGQGLDAKSSMDVCIGLSVDSPLMKAHPEAFELLCTIAMLPEGATYTMLSKWWASSWVGSIGVLRDTALVEQRGATYFVLPVIQCYLLNPSRFSSNVRTSMIESACSFLLAHSSVIGDELFKSHTITLFSQGANLEAILLCATTSDPRILRDGFLLLARHQRHKGPRVDIIKRALSLASAIDDKVLQGDLLFCYGDMLHQLFKTTKSIEQFNVALDVFLSISDRKKAADCRLKLAEVMEAQVGTFDKRQELIGLAEEDCQAIGDEALIARCYLQFGRSYLIQGELSNALEFLTQAEPLLTRAKDWYSHSKCCQALGRTYCQMEKYESASLWMNIGMDENTRIGDAPGCLHFAHDLAKIKSASGDFEGSLRDHLRCLEMAKLLGLPPVGYALEGMGIAWAILGKIGDANKAFEEALRYFHCAENSQYGIVRCRFFLKRLENPRPNQVHPTEEERHALGVWYHDAHVNQILSLL